MTPPDLPDHTEPTIPHCVYPDEPLPRFPMIGVALIGGALVWAVILGVWG